MLTDNLINCIVLGWRFLVVIWFIKLVLSVKTPIDSWRILVHILKQKTLKICQKFALSMSGVHPIWKLYALFQLTFLVRSVDTVWFRIWRTCLSGVNWNSFCVWVHSTILVENETSWCINCLDTTFPIIWSIAEIPCIYLIIGVIHDFVFVVTLRSMFEDKRKH